jgi:Icc-related predicted phosphoesterase
MFHSNPSVFPAGDILIHAGDMTNGGTVDELNIVNQWFGTITQYRHKYVIGGNHDICLHDPNIGRSVLTNVTYLDDELVEVGGVKIYFSPTNFMLSMGWFGVPDQKERCERIPEGIDILVTHGMPYGILDLLPDFDSDHGKANTPGGSQDLLKRVKEVNPKYHIFGHLHDRYGQEKVGDTQFLNVAQASTPLYFGQYREPVVIDI